MRGLPASGKSTRAKEIMEESGNVVRINKDLLRTMLHFDKWSGINESTTRDVARTIASSLLERGTNVLIDDTNLNDGTFQSWKDLALRIGAKVEVINIDTPYAQCIMRDRTRENPVGDHVIVGMALQNGLYPEPQRGFVLCDLDGTLADIRHRLKYVKTEPKDWKSFFEHISEDSPRTEIIELIKAYNLKGFDVIIVSARPDNYRKQTEEWLDKNIDGPLRPYKAVLMRRAGDRRPDTEVKADILSTYFKDLSKISLVIDDRPSVINMWKEKGLGVMDVGNGVEF